MGFSKWPLFVRQCFLQRVQHEQFRELAGLMHKQHNTSGKRVINTILHYRDSLCVPGDPLVAVYIEAVLSLEIASFTDVLVVLVGKWNATVRETDGETPGSPAQDCLCIQQLSMLVQSNSLNPDGKATEASIVCLARWLSAISLWLARDVMRLSLASVTGLFESIGVLLANITATNVGMKVLEENAKQAEPRASMITALQHSLEMTSTISLSLHQRFVAIQNHFKLYEHYDRRLAQTGTETLTADAVNFETNVLNETVVPSRAGLFVYLNALHLRCATIDDSRLLSFLNARHLGDHRAMFINIIVSSFDVNCIATPSRPARQKRWQHFIVNKLPSILAVVSASSFGAVDPEECLRDALHQVQSAAGSTNQYASLCKAFLSACAQHLLVSGDTASKIARDPDFKVSTRPLYVKEELTSQIMSNHQRGIELLERLSDIYEDSAAIAKSVAEVFQVCCQRRETLFLKELTSVMIRKPVLIDTLYLFVRPSLILQPLAQVLNTWDWTNLQVESQPIYDEFGNILLFILTVMRRLNLQAPDLGHLDDTSFFSRFLKQGYSDSLLQDLSDNLKEHLGEWINALFIVAEGLSDELMSSCSANDFYMLVPTLLSQSLIAAQKGKLSGDALKSGFEYLLEPFLLPSLVPAISWLCSPVAREFGLKELSLLLSTFTEKPPTNIEAQEIHHTILQMLGPELVAGKSWELIGRPIDREPFMMPIEPGVEEIRDWSREQGNILVHLQQTIHALITAVQDEFLKVALQVGHAMVINATALETLGATIVVRSLIKELDKFAGSPHYLTAIDVIATLICALSGDQPGMSLQDALVLQYRNISTVLRDDGEAFSEGLVRLQRRTVLYSIVDTRPEMTVEAGPAFMPDLVAIDLDDIHAPPAPGTDMMDQEATQQAPRDIDEMLDAAAVMGGVEQENAADNLDDMFGLQNDDMMVNFDDLDTEGMF